MPRRRTPIQLARDNRKMLTPAEKKLWGRVRNRQLNGYKFLRQHPVIYAVNNNRAQFFILDFYCASAKLVVELDGEIHKLLTAQDEWRDAKLQSLGYRVLRIENKELVDMDAVLRKILSWIEAED